jgi:hypothetical protein
VAEALEQAIAAAGENCVINMFAGTAPGAYAHIDLNAVALRGVRFTGISGSSIADLRRVHDLFARSSPRAPYMRVGAQARCWPAQRCNTMTL